MIEGVRPGQETAGTPEPGTAAEAKEIFDYVREHEGVVRLRGFGAGEFDAPAVGVSLRVPMFDVMRPSFVERGFTEDEIDHGLVVVMEHGESKNTYASMQETGEIKAVQVSLSEADAPAVPTEVHDADLTRIETVSTLSAIPARIVDKFGGAQGFTEHLGGEDQFVVWEMMGTGSAVYPTGLGQFVEGVVLMREEKMDGGTSGRRAMGTLRDNSEYYEGMIRKVNAAKARRQGGTANSS